MTATAMKLLLGRIGIKPDFASCIKNAERALRDTAYSAVLLDLQLPDGSGTALIPFCRQLPTKPIIVVVTGLVDELYDQAVALKPDGMIRKPFRPEALIAEIAAIKQSRSG